MLATDLSGTLRAVSPPSVTKYHRTSRNKVEPGSLSGSIKPSVAVRLCEKCSPSCLFERRIQPFDSAKCDVILLHSNLDQAGFTVRINMEVKVRDQLSTDCLSWVITTSSNFARTILLRVFEADVSATRISVRAETWPEL